MIGNRVIFKVTTVITSNLKHGFLSGTVPRVKNFRPIALQCSKRLSSFFSLKLCKHFILLPCEFHAPSRHPPKFDYTNTWRSF